MEIGNASAVVGLEHSLLTTGQKFTFKSFCFFPLLLYHVHGCHQCKTRGDNFSTNLSHNHCCTAAG